jgi:triacylglycerol lipase
MDLNLAVLLCEFSYFSYEDIEVVKKRFPKYKVTFLSKGNSEAYHFESSDFSAIAFRGTQVTENLSWKDIFSNAKIRKVRWVTNELKRTRIHRGYRNSFLMLSGEIRKLSKITKRPFYLTGHSLGGALATICSTYIDATATYTFGSPRIGNRTFAKVLKDRKLHRFVYENDIAPKWPFGFLGYRHGGTPWIIKKDSRLLNKWSFANMLLFPLTRKGIISGKIDHNILGYFLHLKRLAG